MNQYKSTDKLYAGISAGAILFCKFGMGDQFTYKDRNHYYNYKMVEGLGFLDITICPHYDHDGLICYNDEIWNYPYDGYALEDDTAILLTGSTNIIKREKSKSVYLFSREHERRMIPLYERVEV
ncbi:MAG: Type 1 glutamine amidotransferase-like domain-containing protein, partial [Anaeroplasmataceae bacterium]|nr:Type 1 glutamine amidotransferase-like domain-containing protein [Anaeroplasmataceae bacterium]